MNIFINNQEVVCSRNMQIKESLANTNSVILNNVYPKEWETDKDYTSRFYMPEDYSHCVIKNSNTSTKQYDITNNTYILEHRAINQEQQIFYSAISNLIYIKVMPGTNYVFNITNNKSYNIGLFQTNGLEIGSVVSQAELIRVGENTINITPTTDYLFTYNDVTINSIKVSQVDNIIFSGVIKNSGNINLNPRYPHYATLQLLDYKTLLSEGETLNYVLEKQSVSSAIKKIVKGLEGFYVGNILLETDDIIEAYNCNEKAPYDVLEYLAEITGAIWYTETINEDITLIHFCSIDNLPMADTLEYNQNYFETNNIQDIQYSYSANDYRNKQIITSDSTISSITQTESISYNGVDLRTTYPIAKITKIMIGDKEYSAASNIDKKNGIYADYYYTYGETSIDPNKELATGTILNVTYYSIVNSRQIAYNQEEIDRININTGRNGIISRYEKRTDTNDQTALNQIAQTYIDYKSVPEVTIKVQSYNKDIYELGNRVFFDGPIEALKTNYLVKEKQVDMITTGEQQELFYTYTLSSSFNDKNAINFFDNQRRKLEGNIEERTIHNTL